ncbi:MAG: hypothetical protein QOE75_1212, partial [Solirubrobacterales bacterium]|nr:hypothetical protein [Solirubrobacterales bacterium]
MKMWHVVALVRNLVLLERGEQASVRSNPRSERLGGSRG